MIIKIERYVNNKGELDSNNWWILDDIKKISHSIQKMPFSKNYSIDDAEIFLLDYEQYLTKIGAGQDGRNVISLVCRLSNGDEFRIVFDTVGYILNDSGKTIEKMVANYRSPQN